MFNRTHGSKKSAGFIPTNLFSKDSPSGEVPLLAGAQTPGMSHYRSSETSLNSSEQMSSNVHYGPNGGPRYGPTAGGYGPAAGGYGPQASASSFSSATNYAASANASPQMASGRFTKSAAAESAPLRHSTWGTGVLGLAGIDQGDLDDKLHTFTAEDEKDLSSPFILQSWRGWANGLTLFVLLAGFVVLFAGYPIIDWYYDDKNSIGAGTAGGYNLGGLNASGQIPEIPNFPQLIDRDTPDDVKNTLRVGTDGAQWKLVFSDEFERDGRTFYPGDDPYFTGVDIHYWPTNDFEWYHPDQITTKDGHLVITLAQEPYNNLMFKSGMLQSWNQLCFFKNAYIEARVSLPGTPKTSGFWPGIWTMGNLGRPGYGGTTEGLWPYSYNACDVGILPNQTYVNGTGPLAALNTGDPNQNNGALSFLPGQRISACNCEGTPHPGPDYKTGRGAVEIDMIEAQVDVTIPRGLVSQSAQVAPYDASYEFLNTSKAYVTIYDRDVTHWNTYLGGVYQQAVSGLSYTDMDIYYLESQDFGVFGVEWVAYLDDPSKGHVEWVNMGKPSWRMEAAAVGPNALTEVDQRLISQEPMSLIFNLGMSNNFETVDFDHMVFPNYLRVDYIRVYQLADGSGEIGCDPPERPTAAYIEQFKDIYNNPNITTWALGGQEFPKNKLLGC